MRRSGRRGLVEIVLSWFYVYPFRCQYCGHRFRTLQWGRRYRSGRPDRRRYERLSVDFPVRLSGLPGSARGRMTDLSINGCTVTTDVILADGALVQLTLEVPGRPPFTLETAVVHAQPGSAGLAFVKLADAERDRIYRTMLDFTRART